VDLPAAREKRSSVASCRLPFGIPSFSRLIGASPSRTLFSGAKVRSAIIFAFPILVRSSGKETASVTLVTDAGAGSFDTHKERIGVTIHQQLPHAQDVAARFAFLHSLFRGAAEEHKLLLWRRVSGKRLRVHEAEHQHVAAALVLDDGRHQPAAFLKVDLHDDVS